MTEKFHRKGDDFRIIGRNPVHCRSPFLPSENLNSGNVLRKLDPFQVVAENDAFELVQNFRLLPQSAQVDVPVFDAMPAQVLGDDWKNAVPHRILLSMII